jgi:DNA-binding NtrC family response regulator
MTRVLIVHHDIDIGDQEADSLRRAGYQVEQCQGPIGGRPCPVIRGRTCGAADRADVLLYDVWSTGDSDGGQRLIEGLRDLYPDIPVVLTAPAMELDWVETTGPHRVVPLVGALTTARLTEAIEKALATRTRTATTAG